MIQTRTTIYSLREDGILSARVLPQTEMNLDDVEENFKAIPRESGGKKRYLLADIRGITSVSKGARDEAAKLSNGVFLAQAIIIGNPISKMIATIYTAFSKPPHATRFFVDEEEAVKWLNDLEKKRQPN